MVESLVDQATLFSNSSGCKSMAGSIKFRGKVSGSLAWPSAVFFCDVLEMQCTSVWKRLLIYGLALWDMYATCHLCLAGSTMFDNRKLSNKRNHQDEAFWTGKKDVKSTLLNIPPWVLGCNPENQPPKNGVSSFWTLSNFLGPCCTLRVYLNSKPKLLNLIPARHSQIRKKNQKKSHQRLARQE